MEMNFRVCPLCGSSDSSNIFAEADFDFGCLDNFGFSSRKTPEYMHYRLIDCPICNLLYANPLPNDRCLEESYWKAAYDSSVEAQYAAATYAGTLSSFIGQLPDRNGALDIGAGDGAFLEYLQKNNFCGIVGVEPSYAPIAAASENVRSLIKEGMFKGDDFADESFSLVSCFQTIEHLHDPLVMIRSVFRLLKPGGAVYLICHNRRALATWLLGKKSPIFDIEHLQLFSPVSARYLLQQNGFTGLKIIRIINRYPLRYWFRLLPLPQRIKRTITALLEKKAGGWPLSLPVGNFAIIGFKPDHCGRSSVFN